MSSLGNSNKRIAKNTAFLYVRQLIVLFLSLYTSRIVLDSLGVEDFGIYNVVGGVVLVFNFLNNSMSASTQRFLNFEIGKKRLHKLSLIFSSSIVIHVLLAIVVIILAETLGLWFFYNEMIIPEDRINSAFWVYQFSLISSVIVIVGIPYYAAIVAHENLGFFAIVSVFEVFLKFIAALSLESVGFDKLILYSFFISLISILVRLAYFIYCRVKFTNLKFRFSFDKNMISTMGSFAGWSLFGNLSGIGFTQGLNILLNLFFGPAVNAARGIAVQAQMALQSFTSNFQMAVNPQIVKSYASEDHRALSNLIFGSSKFGFLLTLFLTLPIFFKSDFVLSIWLKEVPNFTSVFLQFGLVIALIDSLANPLMTAAGATGNIKRYQVLIGGILLAIVPISYMFLDKGFSPWIVYLVHLIVALFAQFARIILLKSMINFNVREYAKSVIGPLFFVLTFSSLIVYKVSSNFTDGWISFLLTLFLSTISIIIFTILFGLNSDERKFLVSKVTVLKINLKK